MLPSSYKRPPLRRGVAETKTAQRRRRQAPTTSVEPRPALASPARGATDAQVTARPISKPSVLGAQEVRPHGGLRRHRFHSSDYRHPLRIPADAPSMIRASRAPLTQALTPLRARGGRTAAPASRGDSRPLIMFGAFLAAFFSPSTFRALARLRLTPLLAVTMLGGGLSSRTSMIARHPKPVILGVLSQYAVSCQKRWVGRGEPAAAVPSASGHHPHRLRARRDDVERVELPGPDWQRSR